MELKNPPPRFVQPTTILCFGVRTAFGPTYPSSAKLKKGDMVMLDLNNEHDGYMNDETMMKIFGTPTKEQREIHELNLQMHEKGLSAIRLGAKARDMLDAIVKVAREAGYEVRGCTCHGIGMDIQEKPDV